MHNRSPVLSDVAPQSACSLLIMPPSKALYTAPPRDSFTTLIPTVISAQLLIPALCVLLLISCFRLALALQSRRRERAISRSITMNETDKKDQKQDSLSPERPVKKESPTSQPSPLPTSMQRQVETPTYKPIYPWTAPPHRLPGPYDPPYYPLPTLRRHSSSDSTSTTTSSAHEQKTEAYTRRVSTNSIPIQESILRGTVTTSPDGWRRNQWTVSGG